MSYREEQYYTPYKVIANGDYSEVNFDELLPTELKNLWKKTINSGMHGLCFSMYEDGQSPGDVITEEQVERRIKIIKPHTKWVRSFSCIEGNEHIPKVAHKHGIKTMVGAWLSDDLKKNEQEIEGLIELANAGYVDVAAVGNEVLYRNDLTKEELLEYIDMVKEALPNIPIGYVDAYYEFTQHPDIVDACDVILANCYPYWEGTDLNYSLQHMQHMYAQVKSAANGKPIIISETGWPSRGAGLKGAFPSEENAMKYFINSQRWSASEGVELFYFSSFDESWKVGAEGDVGAYWGLWDKSERLKFN